LGASCVRVEMVHYKWEYEITFFGRNTFQDVGNKEGRISATCKIKILIKQNYLFFI
jgi:hypothetical protein